MNYNEMTQFRQRPDLPILWWDSVAPLGLPVVPEVNWMLVGSSLSVHNMCFIGTQCSEH